MDLFLKVYSHMNIELLIRCYAIELIEGIEKEVVGFR